MNGVSGFASTTEQHPADSSGLTIMSDSDFASSDSSTGTFANVATLPVSNGIREAMNTSTVQSQASYLTNSSNLYTQSVPLPIPTKYPPSGKPVSMKSCEPPQSDQPRSKNTDHFLNQFQAQMSQMKSAMDAVQNEILHHCKPRASDSILSPALTPVTGIVKRGPGRPRGSGNAKTGPQGVRYQSQISATNGLKLKIKKSPHQQKKRGPKGKRRGKRRKGDEDDDDDLSDADSERRVVNPKSTKFSHASMEDMAEGDGTERSPVGWGDKLPESVLAKILAYAVKYEEGCIPVLVRASKVSRLWWKVASRPELWTSVDLSSSRVRDKFKIERNLIYFVENRFQKVKHLNIGGWSTALTNNSIDAIIRNCTDLESLGLSSCQKLTAQHLKQVAESCKCLKKLDLSAISTTYNTKTAVSPGAISDAAEAMGDNMTHISLANNCLANCPQIVTSLADNCPNLQALDLSNVTSPRRDSIAINIEHLQQGCNKLKILRLTNSDFYLSETPLKEQVCSPGFPELEELSIAVDPKKCQGMDEGDLERILKNANKLRLLDVRGCSRIGDSGLVRISAWDLEHLYLSGCYATKSSNDGLELVAKKWRHSFKEIDFSWTPGEETINSAMKALAEVESSEVVPPLRMLDLCGSSVSFDSVKLTLKSCTNLERLNLTSCRALPRGIKRNYQLPEEIITLREQVLSGKYDDHQND